MHEQLVQKFYQKAFQYPKEDQEKILSAALYADELHGEQKRKSGEPYIIHPLAVGSILIQLGMDADTICAGLLHDVVEDTDATLKDIEDRFGAEVAQMGQQPFPVQFTESSPPVLRDRHNPCPRILAFHVFPGCQTFRPVRHGLFWSAGRYSCREDVQFPFESAALQPGFEDNDASCPDFFAMNSAGQQEIFYFTVKPVLHFPWKLVLSVRRIYRIFP